MKKRLVVKVGELNCRVIKTSDVEQYRGIEGYVVDPDLSLVSHLPPHLWKLGKKGCFEPLTADEAEQRWKDVEVLHGGPADTTAAKRRKKVDWLPLLAAFAAGIALAAAILETHILGF